QDAGDEVAGALAKFGGARVFGGEGADVLGGMHEDVADPAHGLGASHALVDDLLEAGAVGDGAGFQEGIELAQAVEVLVEGVLKQGVEGLAQEESGGGVGALGRTRGLRLGRWRARAQSARADGVGDGALSQGDDYDAVGAQPQGGAQGDVLAQASVDVELAADAYGGKEQG